MDLESSYKRPAQDLEKVFEHREKEDLDLFNSVSLSHTFICPRCVALFASSRIEPLGTDARSRPCTFFDFGIK